MVLFAGRDSIDSAEVLLIPLDSDTVTSSSSFSATAMAKRSRAGVPSGATLASRETLAGLRSELSTSGSDETEIVNSRVKIMSYKGKILY